VVFPEANIIAKSNLLQSDRHMPDVGEIRPRFSVLRVPVDAVQIPDVVTWIETQIERRSGCRFIAVTGMHGVVEAQHDVSFLETLTQADLVVPDGMPLVWFARKRGYALGRRVYGPELLETFCRATGGRYRHFFYGGVPGVAERLADHLLQKYGVSVAGCYAPPFRALNSREDDEIVNLIHESAADVVWVGLSTPKQEWWMHEHRNSLRVPVLVGVGAAFDLLIGRVRQAPPWMQENGVEWLFRLLQEPERLWRRYLIYGSEFAWKAGLEVLGLKRFD